MNSNGTIKKNPKPMRMCLGTYYIGGMEAKHIKIKNTAKYKMWSNDVP